MVIIALFCSFMKTDPVSLLRFPLFNHVFFISCAISSNCHSKYSYSCFSLFFLCTFVVLLFWCIFPFFSDFACSRNFFIFPSSLISHQTFMVLFGFLRVGGNFVTPLVKQFCSVMLFFGIIY